MYTETKEFKLYVSTTYGARALPVTILCYNVCSAISLVVLYHSLALVRTVPYKKKYHILGNFCVANFFSKMAVSIISQKNILVNDPLGQHYIK